MIHALAKFVVSCPRRVLLAFGVLTIVAGYFAATQLTMRVALEDLLPANHKNVELFQRFAGQFGGANTTIIAVRNKEGMIYTPEFLQTYKDVTDKVYFNTDTIRPLTQSLALRKTKAVSGKAGIVQITATMWPGVPQTEAELGKLRQVVRAQFIGHLVSDDEQSAVVIADFKDDADPLQVRQFLEELRAEFESDSVEIAIVGRPLLLGIIKGAIPDVVMIFGISFAIIALILLLYFRAWHGLVAPLLTASVVMVWGLGIAGLYRYNLDPLLVLLPAFIFAIVLSHAVQLTSRVLENWRDGMEWDSSVENALRNLLVPGLGAVVTDAAGFLVLLLVDIPTIKSLAIVCALWLLSIIPAQIFAAALLSASRPPKKFRVGFPGMGKLWTLLAFHKTRKPIVAVGIVAFIGGFVGMQNLTVGDAEGSAILWEHSRFNRDTSVVNRNFSRLGTDVLQIYVEGDDNAMLAPDTYRRVEALDRSIYETVEAARPAQSLVPIIKAINMVLWEGDPSYFIIPETDREVGLNLYMFRSRGEPGDFAAYTDREWSIGTMAFFLSDHAAPTVTDITTKVENYVADKNRQSSTQFLYSGGQIGLTEATNTELSAANQRIFIAIVAVIAVCVGVFTRSLVLTGIVLVTLLSATFLTYTLMSVAGIGLSLATLPLAALGIGLGVDYAIYLIGRLREEQRKGVPGANPLRAAFLTSGGAIIATALTMIVPLLPWAVMSALKFQAEMGVLLGAVLALNMLGAIIIIPAAICWFRPKLNEAPDTVAAGGLADPVPAGR